MVVRRQRNHSFRLPANSPDLNPTEDVFGALVRRVYAGNRQFGTVAALKEAIVEAWADIDFDELEPLTLMN